MQSLQGDPSTRLPKEPKMQLVLELFLYPFKASKGTQNAAFYADPSIGTLPVSLQGFVRNPRCSLKPYTINPKP